jgi:uncharacterized membrane protein (DUF373 family)
MIRDKRAGLVKLLAIILAILMLSSVIGGFVFAIIAGI